MSIPFAIRVEHLGKKYLLGARHSGQRTLRDALLGRFNGKGSKGGVDELWALQDVNFTVEPGEVVGIIGRNGAGKSTLLKVLSRITEPTRGRVEIFGRTGSLLEVGTGFHPELSGRENIYLNGAILGMRKNEIARRFDEIVDFAGVARFVDTPVKRYSSGMFLRLAFAVAAHLDPEILIVDEVLAVGDAAFQQKCLNKMGDVARAGRTVLFVSHNMPAIKHLCPRAIVLNSGCVAYDGASHDAVKVYLSNALGGADRGSVGMRFENPAPDANRAFEVTSVEVLDREGRLKPALATGEYARFRLRWRAAEAMRHAGVELGVYTPEGVPLIQYSTRPVADVDLDFQPGENSIECEFSQFPVAAGQYYLSVGLTRPMLEWLYREDQFALFDVEPGDVFNSGTPVVSSRALMVVPHRWLNQTTRHRDIKER
ncbi:MAG: ABC transporter ATP-binding protein [Acidobacteria bacterium]|nr:ABC transporter ATP-binding protein [Acidobacteriota bacterium]MCW5969301.1 ABC transporter ATP-binding protein [Blastocatellales bacterium]